LSAVGEKLGEFNGKWWSWADFSDNLSATGEKVGRILARI